MRGNTALTPGEAYHVWFVPSSVTAKSQESAASTPGSTQAVPAAVNCWQCLAPCSSATALPSIANVPSRSNPQTTVERPDR